MKYHICDFRKKHDFVKSVLNRRAHWIVVTFFIKGAILSTGVHRHPAHPQATVVVPLPVSSAAGHVGRDANLILEPCRRARAIGRTVFTTSDQGN